MREIEFRGKDIFLENWRYGFPFIDRKGNCKIKWYCKDFGTSQTSNVYDKSLGQYTGLNDKNGKKIYDGDILSFDYQGKKKSVVTFETGMFKAGGTSLITWTHMQCKCEVIGNIFDNPELLEE